jgi:ABC-2 type transport system permease protein
MSSLTKNQVVAFILGVIVNFALAIVGFGVFAEGIERLLGVAAADTLSYLGYSPHFQNMLRGIVEVRDLVYFLSIIVAGLILNGLIIEDKQAQ